MPYPASPSFQLYSAEAAYPITPSDTTAGPCPFKQLYVGGTGTVTIVDLSGNVVLFSGVPAGTVLPVGGSRVNATGTSATLIVGLV